MQQQQTSDVNRRESEQLPASEPNATVGKDTPPSLERMRLEAEERLSTSSRAQKRLRKIQNASPIVTAFATVGILIATVVYAIFAFEQWSTMHEQFVAFQRAAIYLGLPDGSTGRLDQIGVFALEFRNYGLSSAENVVIEVWPAIISFDHRPPPYESRVEIPAFRGFDPARTGSTGFPIPPGFPFTIRRKIDSIDWQMVKSGTAQLQVLVRVSYMTDFGDNCHALTVTYSPEARKFILGPRPSQDFCGDRSQVARFIASAVP